MPAATFTSGGSAIPGYNLNPKPTQGTNAYGQVPGQIGKPPSLYEGVSSIYPGLGTTVANASNLISSQLAGEFSPETEAALWDTANKYGVASGMPGSKLWGNKFMGNVAGYKESLQNQGLQNYGNIMQTLSGMVDNPALLAEIASNNAALAAAPDPQAAAKLAQSLAAAGVSDAMKYGIAPQPNIPQGGYSSPQVNYPSMGGGGYMNGTIYSMNPLAGPQAETQFTTQAWLNSIGYTGAGGNAYDSGYYYAGENNFDDPALWWTDQDPLLDFPYAE